MEGEGESTNDYHILFNLQNSIFLSLIELPLSIESSGPATENQHRNWSTFLCPMCSGERGTFRTGKSLSAKPSSKALIFISMHSPVGWMFYDQIWVATNGNFNHKPPTLPVLQRAGQASQGRPLHSGRIPLTVLDKTAIDYCPWGFSRPQSRLSALKINKEQLKWNWALWHYINAMLKTRIHITGLETIS